MLAQLLKSIEINTFISMATVAAFIGSATNELNHDPAIAVEKYHFLSQREIISSPKAMKRMLRVVVKGIAGGTALVLLCSRLFLGYWGYWSFPTIPLLLLCVVLFDILEKNDNGTTATSDN
jgi:hypothetical protein